MSRQFVARERASERERGTEGEREGGVGERMEELEQEVTQNHSRIYETLYRASLVGKLVRHRLIGPQHLETVTAVTGSKAARLQAVSLSSK